MMTLDSIVYEVKMACLIREWLSSYLFLELPPVHYFFRLFCAPHNWVTFQNIIMKLSSIVYEFRMACLKQD